MSRIIRIRLLYVLATTSKDAAVPTTCSSLYSHLTFRYTNFNDQDDHDESDYSDPPRASRQQSVVCEKKQSVIKRRTNPPPRKRTFTFPTDPVSQDIYSIKAPCSAGINAGRIAEHLLRVQDPLSEIE